MVPKWSGLWRFLQAVRLKLRQKSWQCCFDALFGGKVVTMKCPSDWLARLQPHCLRSGVKRNFGGSRAMQNRYMTKNPAFLSYQIMTAVYSILKSNVVPSGKGIPLSSSETSANDQTSRRFFTSLTNIRSSNAFGCSFSTVPAASIAPHRSFTSPSISAQ
jgi:hypothetical protein